MGTLRLTAVLFVAVEAAFAFMGSGRAVAVVLLIVGLLAALLLLQDEQWQALPRRRAGWPSDCR